jgi:Ca2+ transporting ATPase
MSLIGRCLYYSLSENQSLLVMPPWRNKWLIGAIFLSMAQHFLILYTPILATVFQITPLSGPEWIAVLELSVPVIALDEILKALSRSFDKPGSAKPKEQ